MHSGAIRGRNKRTPEEDTGLLVAISCCLAKPWRRTAIGSGSLAEFVAMSCEEGKHGALLDCKYQHAVAASWFFLRIGESSTLRVQW